MQHNNSITTSTRINEQENHVINALVYLTMDEEAVLLQKWLGAILGILETMEAKDFHDRYWKKFDLAALYSDVEQAKSFFELIGQVSRIIKSTKDSSGWQKMLAKMQKGKGPGEEDIFIMTKVSDGVELLSKIQDKYQEILDEYEKFNDVLWQHFQPNDFNLVIENGCDKPGRLVHQALSSFNKQKIDLSKSKQPDMQKLKKLHAELHAFEANNQSLIFLRNRKVSIQSIEDDAKKIFEGAIAENKAKAQEIIDLIDSIVRNGFLTQEQKDALLAHKNLARKVVTDDHYMSYDKVMENLLQSELAVKTIEIAAKEAKQTFSEYLQLGCKKVSDLSQLNLTFDMTSKFIEVKCKLSVEEENAALSGDIEKIKIISEHLNALYKEAVSHQNRFDQYIASIAGLMKNLNESGLCDDARERLRNLATHFELEKFLGAGQCDMEKIKLVLKGVLKIADEVEDKIVNKPIPVVSVHTSTLFGVSANKMLETIENLPVATHALEERQQPETQTLTG